MRARGCPEGGEEERGERGLTRPSAELPPLVVGKKRNARKDGRVIGFKEEHVEGAPGGLEEKPGSYTGSMGKACMVGGRKPYEREIQEGGSDVTPQARQAPLPGVTKQKKGCENTGEGKQAGQPKGFVPALRKLRERVDQPGPPGKCREDLSTRIR